MTVDEARAALKKRTITALDPQTGEQVKRTVLDDVAAHADFTQSWAHRIEDVDGERFIVSAAPNPHHRGDAPAASYRTDGHLHVTADGVLQRITPRVVEAAAIPLDADQAAGAMARLRDAHDGSRRSRALYPLSSAEADAFNIEVTRDAPTVMGLVEFEAREVDAAWALEAVEDRKSQVRVQRFEAGTQPDDYQA